ncbi:MAG: tRNA epoxyqueuosine(34) reductase QueG [Pseudomonadota bacterium]
MDGGQHPLVELLREEAAANGFSAFGVCRPSDIEGAEGHLNEFLAAGRHGDMAWLAATATRRANPRKLWSDCRSIIMLGANYGPETDPMLRLSKRERGVVSAYAKGRDYHDVLKGRLKQIAGKFAARSGGDVKVFVDTAPVMEKPLAAAAGLGWQGKHTNLVSRTFGSWLFLGAIMSNLELPTTDDEIDHCGSCRACLDVCPTNAFPAPYQLDARRCIAYLTIEYQGSIAREFRAPMGNRVFGCDDCLAVCPWNKFAQVAQESRFHPRVETDDPPLAELLVLDDAAFRKRFAGTPVKRTGRDRFLRNVLIAVGNSGDRSLKDAVVGLMRDASPLVRAMAVWAAARLCEPEEFAGLAVRRQVTESDPSVLQEWRAETGE